MAETQEKKPFNPNEHLSKVQKPNDYLQVKWRLVWFRDEHPHGKITTSMVHLDVEKQIAVFKATAEDSAGGVGEGYGSETVKDFKDYIEKAETKAIGRALAALGYGTQFAPDLDEGERIVDSPVERTSKPSSVAATEQQLSSIRKLYLALGKTMPQRELTHDQAKSAIEKLSKAYRDKQNAESVPLDQVSQELTGKTVEASA